VHRKLNDSDTGKHVNRSTHRLLVIHGTPRPFTVWLEVDQLIRRTELERPLVTPPVTISCCPLAHHPSQSSCLCRSTPSHTGKGKSHNSPKHRQWHLFPRIHRPHIRLIDRLRQVQSGIRKPDRVARHFGAKVGKDGLAR
jgi:hypothetical protein